MRRQLAHLIGVILAMSTAAWGEPAPAPAPASAIAEHAKPAAHPHDQPTYADVAYGPDARNVMDVYLAKRDKPTPCVVYIHGGGWLQGDKSTLGSPKAFIEAGISVVAINYRYLKQTIVDTHSTRGTGPGVPAHSCRASE